MSLYQGVQMRMLRFWCICICWQHAGPKTCNKNFTSKSNSTFGTFSGIRPWPPFSCSPAEKSHSLSTKVRSFYAKFFFGFCKPTVLNIGEYLLSLSIKFPPTWGIQIQEEFLSGWKFSCNSSSCCFSILTFGQKSLGKFILALGRCNAVRL